MKPTTGGVHSSLLYAEVAVNALLWAHMADDLPSAQRFAYWKEWQAEIGYDLHLAYWVRKLYHKMTFRQTKQILNTIESNDFHELLLGSEDFFFDRYGELISRILRSEGYWVALLAQNYSFLFLCLGFCLAQ